MGDLSEHFSRYEFACPCCGFGFDDDDVSQELVDLLERLRFRLGGFPVHINSGCRCPNHNRRVGGVRNSQHLRGTAADIVIVGVAPERVYEMADEINPDGGVGWYDTFTHVDTRGHRARWDNRRRT